MAWSANRSVAWSVTLFRDNMAEFNVSTPIKSPAPKKSRGDERAIDVEAMPDSGSQSSTQPPAWAAAMQQQILAGVRGVIQDEMQAVKTEVKILTNRVESVEITTQQARACAEETKNIAVSARDSKSAISVDEITKIIETKLEMRTTNESEHIDTAVFGRFGHMTEQAAQDWISHRMKQFNLPEPVEMYYKGDEFKGIVYAKYPNKEMVRRVSQNIQNDKQ